MITVREYAVMNMTDKDAEYCEKIENAIEQALSCIDIDPDAVDEIVDGEMIGARIDLTEIDDTITKKPTSMQALYFLDASANGWIIRLSRERSVSAFNKENICCMAWHIHAVASVRL